MIKQPTRSYTAIAGLFLLVQGISTLSFHLYPAFDQAFPALLATTQMIPPHSILHIVTGLLALWVLLWGGTHSSFWFATGFGLFYIGLGFTGMVANHMIGLGLQAFDHPFHFLVGGLGILAAGFELYRSRRRKNISL